MELIVVGAGLAGLAATRRLVEAGHDVTLVEARDRLGGRVMTEHVDGAALDLGAEWVANTGVVRDALTRAGEEVYESDGRFLRRDGNRFVRAWDGDSDENALFARIASLGGSDRSLDAALAALGIPSDGARGTRRYVRGFHAADPADVSVRWLVRTQETQPPDESSFRCTAGAARVADALLPESVPRARILLNTAVRAVRWRAGRVELDVDGELSELGATTLVASAAVITLPLPVLAALPCTPELPQKRDARSLLRMGHAAKVALAFRTPFWRAIPGLADMHFLFASDAAFPTFWTGRGAVINAWCGGPDARAVSGISHDDAIARATQSFAHALGVSVADVDAQLLGARRHDWSADPCFRGAYTYVGVGGMDAHAALAMPVSDTLYFAGEATAGDGFNATMEGAVTSGDRAAEEMLKKRGAR